MRRREFFKLVGLTAAVGAAASLSACGASPVKTTASSDGEQSVVGQPQVLFSAETDVLIVGSGVAGLSAAMAPVERGHKVMVAEKLGVLGGESYDSNAILRVAGSQLQKDAGINPNVDDLWAVRKKELQSVGVSDVDFAKRLFYKAPEWVDKLRSDYGGQFSDPSAYAAEGLNEDIVLPKNGIADMESIMVPLRDKLAARGVVFNTGYRATAFVVDEAGLACGMRFSVQKDGSQTVDVRAKRVVLATGGFTSNQALVHDYLPNVQYVGCYTTASMGEGQQLAQSIGGELSDMGIVTPLIGDIPQVSAWGLFAPVVAVDARGSRFAREDAENDVATACFDDGRGYWWTVFDGQMSSSGQSRSAAQVTSKNAKRLIGPVNSLDELAQAMGVSAEVLKGTFARYDAAVEAKSDGDFGRTGHLDKLNPPYYAIKQFPVRFRTRGGAKVDKRGRLQSAAGIAVGNVHCCGAVASVAASGLATNGACGMIVGEAVADALDAIRERTNAQAADPRE